MPNENAKKSANKIALFTFYKCLCPCFLMRQKWKIMVIPKIAKTRIANAVLGISHLSGGKASNNFNAIIAIKT